MILNGLIIIIKWLVLFMKQYRNHKLVFAKRWSFNFYNHYFVWILIDRSQKCISIISYASTAWLISWIESAKFLDLMQSDFSYHKYISLEICILVFHYSILQVASFAKPHDTEFIAYTKYYTFKPMPIIINIWSFLKFLYFYLTYFLQSSLLQQFWTTAKAR